MVSILFYLNHETVLTFTDLWSHSSLIYRVRLIIHGYACTCMLKLYYILSSSKRTFDSKFSTVNSIHLHCFERLGLYIYNLHRKTLWAIYLHS